MKESRKPEVGAFADRLNASLDALGFPPKGRGRQAALANIMKVSQKGARKWLEGEAYPSESRRRDLAEFCGVRYEWLYAGVGPTHDGESGGTLTTAPDQTDQAPFLGATAKASERVSIEVFLKKLPSDIPPAARALVEQVLVKSKSKELSEGALLILLSLVSQLIRES